MANVNTRVFFSKMNRAKYISHLDLNRVFMRALRKSKLPVWYTEGYNPHLYAQFMLPLSLGQESLREAMDIKLTDNVPPEEVIKRLNDALPDDIRVVEVASPVLKNTEIAFAVYEVTANINIEKFKEFLNSDSIIVEKKTKRGSSEIDLKKYAEVSFEGEKIIVKTPAGNDLNINPALLFEAFEARFETKISYIRILRTKILDKNGGIFR